MAELTATTALAPASACCLRARLPRMYGMNGQRQRPGRAGARPHAPRHHRRRARRAQRRRRRVVDERAPVADGPVVAHGADHGQAQGGAGRDRRGRRQHVLRVDDVGLRVAGDGAQPRGRARPEPLVLEVVADKRHRRRGLLDGADAEPVVRRGRARPATRRGPARPTPRGRERAGRAPARTCSSRCRRRREERRRSRSGSASSAPAPASPGGSHRPVSGSAPPS